MPETGPGPREDGTRALLDALIDGDQEQGLDYNDLLAGLGRRAFGMLLFVASLPAFIPIPVGGALSGPLVALIGLQLIVGLRKPWVPAFIGRRGPRRSTMARFCDRISPAMARLEHLVRPRLRALTRSRMANAYTGVLLICLGLLLALPLPMTNFVFAGTLLLFALALMERDGALMLAAWGIGLAALATTGALSGGLVAMVEDLAARWG